MPITVSVLTISDGCFRSEREDVSGKVLAETLQADGYALVTHEILPDETELIADKLRQLLPMCDLIVTTGGTGFSPRDVTPEAAKQVIKRDAPGLAELLRWTGYQKLPRAVLSRGVAGIAAQTLIITLPGSPGGVRDGLEVLLPLLPHAIALLKDEPVDHTPGGSRGVGSQVSGQDNPVLTPNTQHPTPNSVSLLETNLDDFSPEFYEPLMERLFEAGALDVFFSPIQMKKNRPATMLTVICATETRETMAEILFLETTTFGVRHTQMERFVLEREFRTVTTEYGEIRVKVGLWKGRQTSASPEYESVKAAAKVHGVPAKQVSQAALGVFHSEELSASRKINSV